MVWKAATSMDASLGILDEKERKMARFEDKSLEGPLCVAKADRVANIIII